jgi:hypothetical protein
MARPVHPLLARLERQAVACYLSNPHKIGDVKLTPLHRNSDLCIPASLKHRPPRLPRNSDLCIAEASTSLSRSDATAGHAPTLCAAFWPLPCVDHDALPSTTPITALGAASAMARGRGCSRGLPSVSNWATPRIKTKPKIHSLHEEHRRGIRGLTRRTDRIGSIRQTSTRRGLSHLACSRHDIFLVLLGLLHEVASLMAETATATPVVLCASISGGRRRPCAVTSGEGVRERRSR